MNIYFIIFVKFVINIILCFFYTFKKLNLLLLFYFTFNKTTPCRAEMSSCRRDFLFGAPPLLFFGTDLYVVAIRAVAKIVRRSFSASGVSSAPLVVTIDVPAFSKEADKIYPVRHQIELLRRWWLFPHSSKCNVMRCATERFLALENVALFSAFSLWNLLFFITVKMHALFLLEEVFHRHTDVFRWDDLDARYPQPKGKQTFGDSSFPKTFHVTAKLVFHSV